MTDLAALKFFVTPSHSCSYLPRQDATTLFADPNLTLDSKTYSNLSELGFRRSGEYLYRPHCAHCTACIPARVPTAKFTRSRRQRRVWKKNQDLEINILPAKYEEKHYLLYAKYIEAKHADGDMFPPTEDQYKSFLMSKWSKTNFVEFNLEDTLVALTVFDELNHGISAVYTFYDPDFQQRSLGVYAVLWQLEHAKKNQITYLYLGYWIKECQKMSYKSEYQPLELLSGNQWTEDKKRIP